VLADYYAEIETMDKVFTYDSALKYDKRDRDKQSEWCEDIGVLILIFFLLLFFCVCVNKNTLFFCLTMY
jgi:hypothetical protein